MSLWPGNIWCAGIDVLADINVSDEAFVQDCVNFGEGKGHGRHASFVSEFRQL